EAAPANSSAGAPTASRPAGLPAFLRDLPPEAVPDVLAAYASLAGGHFQAALDAATALRRKGVPDAATGLLAANALVGLEEPTKALVEIRRAVAAAPDAVEVLLVEAK